MKKKLLFLLTALFLSATVLAGCGKKDDTTDKEKAAETKADSKAKDKKAEPKEDSGNTNTEYADLIKEVEERTEGKAKVIYTNDKPHVHKLEDVTISLDSYELIELKDFNQQHSTPFGGQTDGAVMLAKFTINNAGDKDVYRTPSFYMTYPGAKKDIGTYRGLLPDEVQLSDKIRSDENFVIKAGKEVSGYYGYALSPEELKDVLAQGSVEMEVDQAFSKKDSYITEEAIGKKGKFHLALTDAGADRNTSNEKFYQDKATVDNMGDKKLLKEEKPNQTEKVQDFEITFDGYQFTEFTPNEEEARRFSSFKNGIVLLTAKFNIKNDSSEKVSKSLTRAKLEVNDGSQSQLSEGLLTMYSSTDDIPAGDSGELLQVFVLDKEQYEKIWKDKTFKIELGPITDSNAKDISKGKKVEFKF